MRCSGWSSLAISVCRGAARLAPALGLVLASLVVAGTAAAHVVATPQFLPSRSTESIGLAAPNERDEPMTGFAVTAPPGLVIEHAHEVPGWNEEFDATSATWTGGSLAPRAETSFGISLRAATEPGAAVLQAEQRYPGGETVRWPVAMTVLPATGGESQNLALAAVVGVIGLLVVAAVAMLAWRRSTPSNR